MKIGQELFAPSHEDPDGPKKKCRISRVFHNDPMTTIIVRFDNGLILQGTAEHLFWIPQRGWISCENLQVGDSCVDENGNPVKVVSKELVVDPLPVYNIEVEGCHTYFIGKDGKYVLVHNDCPENPGTSYKSLSRDFGMLYDDEFYRNRDEILRRGIEAEKALLTEVGKEVTIGKATKSAGVMLAAFSAFRKGRKAAKAAETVIDAAGNAAKHADEVADVVKKANDGIKLTGAGRRKLGNLVDMKDKNITDAIRERGGHQGNIKIVAPRLHGMTVGELANLAAKGDAEAETAIKILKQAPKKAQIHKNK